MGVIVFMKKKINEKRTHGINNNRQTFAGFSTNTLKVNSFLSNSRYFYVNSEMLKGKKTENDLPFKPLFSPYDINFSKDFKPNKEHRPLERR